MKIGFIGAGNMASAILRGMVRSKRFDPAVLSAFDTQAQKTAMLGEELGIGTSRSAGELVETCDTVVLAVKPNVFPVLLPELREALKKRDALVISIAAGKTIDYIEGLLGYDAAVIRIMPNINATVGAAMSAYCCSARVTDEQRALAEAMCGSFGGVMPLAESMFPLFGVLAGCAPAYSYMFIDALARAGVKNGMAKADALHIAAQTVLGSAKQILESGTHPWELIDRVCSPGGTTIEGVASLQADAFDAAISRAVDAALEKDSRI